MSRISDIMDSHDCNCLTYQQMRSLIIVGPSGVGKGTIIKHLMQRHPIFQFNLSFTTRPKRPLQVEGKDYSFLTMPDFIQKINNYEVLEFKKVFDNYYGSSKQSFLNILQNNKVPLFDVDVRGMQDIVKTLSDPAKMGMDVLPPIVLCVMPPSMTVLRERLTGRGTQTQAVIERRMKENLSQIKSIEQFRGENIFFTTNYQFQLTVFGIEQFLQQHLGPFKNEKRKVEE